MTSLVYILKELANARVRMCMSIATIVWGTVSITILLAIGEGIRTTMLRANKGIERSTIVIFPGQASLSYRGLPTGREIRLQEADVRLARERVPEIEAISGEKTGMVEIRYSERWKKGVIKGVDSDYGLIRNIVPLPGGRFINPIDVANHRRVAVIGPQVKEYFFAEDTNPIGKFIEIDGRPFMVVGVMRKKFESAVLNAADAESIWIPNTTFRAIYGTEDYTYIVIRPRSAKEARKAIEGMYRVIAFNHRCDPTDKKIMEPWNTAEALMASVIIVYCLQVVLGVVGGLALIISGAGIANVMYFSVNKAIPEIGIRLAVGARRYQILIHYAVEGVVVTAIGGALGILLSNLIVYAVDLIPLNMGFLEIFGKPTPVLSMPVFAIVLGVLGITGLMAGIFPAHRAARIEPTEALRHI